MTLHELSKTLTGRMRAHLNQGSKGHILIHDIIDPKGKVIGGKRTVSIRGKSTVTYFLGNDKIETAERFLKAYQQQLRDEEFEASQPEKRDATGSR